LRIVTFLVSLLLISEVVLLIGIVSGVMVRYNKNYVNFDGTDNVSGYAFLVRGTRVFIDVSLHGNVSGLLAVTFRDLDAGKTWSWSTPIATSSRVVGPMFIVPRTGFYSFTVRVESSEGPVGLSLLLTCVPGPGFREGLLHRALWGSLPVASCCLVLALLGLLLKFVGVKWFPAELVSWEITSSFKAYAALACVVFVLLCFIKLGNYAGSSIDFIGSSSRSVPHVVLTATFRAIRPLSVEAFMVVCTVFAVGLAVLTFNHDAESGAYGLYISLGLGRGRVLVVKAAATALLASSPLVAYSVVLASMLLGPAWLNTCFLRAVAGVALVASLLAAALLSLAFLGAAIPLRSVYSLMIALLIGLTGLERLGVPSVKDLMLAAIADPSIHGLVPILTPYAIFLMAVLAGLALRYYLMDYG